MSVRSAARSWTSRVRSSSRQQRSRQQHCSDVLLGYVLDLLQVSRHQGRGLSPRAGQGLLAAARSWSLLQGRDHVRVDDVQAVLSAVFEHRLDAGTPGGVDQPLSQALLQSVNALH